MIAIACPWCQDDGPMDLEVVQAAGGSWTCPACRTTVELVAEADDAWPLAA